MAKNKHEEMQRHFREMAKDLMGYIGIPDISLMRHLAELASTGTVAAGVTINGLDDYLAASPKDAYAALIAGGVPRPWAEGMEDIRARYLEFASICQDKSYHEFIALKMLEVPGPLQNAMEGFKIAQEALEYAGAPIPKWESIQKIIDDFTRHEREHKATAGESVPDLSEMETGIIRENMYGLATANTWEAQKVILQSVNTDPRLSHWAKKVLLHVSFCVLFQAAAPIIPRYANKLMNAAELFAENAGAHIYEVFHNPVAEGCRKGYTIRDAWTYTEPNEGALGVREFTKGSPIFVRGETATHYEVASAYDFTGKPEDFSWMLRKDCIFLKEDQPKSTNPKGQVTDELNTPVLPSSHTLVCLQDKK